MLTDNQIERLASATNVHRPDWPVRSLVTFIAEQRQRTYRDVAVALAWIACDPETKTPGRLREAGPWWTAANVESSEGFERYRKRCLRHNDQRAGQCERCADESAPPPPDLWDQYRDAPKLQPRTPHQAAQEAQGPVVVEDPQDRANREAIAQRILGPLPEAS